MDFEKIYKINPLPASEWSNKNVLDFFDLIEMSNLKEKFS